MKRRFLFKVLLSMILIVLVSGTFSTGIIQVELDINQFFYHKAFAYVFLASILIHLVINRKALRAYFRRHTAAKPAMVRPGRPPTVAPLPPARGGYPDGIAARDRRPLAATRSAPPGYPAIGEPDPNRPALPRQVPPLCPPRFRQVSGAGPS